MGLIRRYWVWTLVIVGATVAILAFRLNQDPEEQHFTAKVEKGDIRQVIDATGTINPVTSVQNCNCEHGTPVEFSYQLGMAHRGGRVRMALSRVTGNRPAGYCV